MFLYCLLQQTRVSNNNVVGNYIYKYFSRSSNVIRSTLLVEFYNFAKQCLKKQATTTRSHLHF